MSLGYKLIGGLVTVVLLIWGVTYLQGLWYKPEKWNPTAAGYKVRGDSLQHEATALVRLNATKDSVIADIATRWKDAIAYGDKWKADLTKQYAITDSYAERLTQAQREQENFTGLQNNGTLDKNLDVKTLTPGDGRVVLANLKTVQRQASDVKTLDSVSTVIGVLTVKTDRMGGTLKRTGKRIATVNTTIDVAIKKAKFLGFETKQSKRLRAASDSLKAVQADVNRESELEREINKRQ